MTRHEIRFPPPSPVVSARRVPPGEASGRRAGTEALARAVEDLQRTMREEIRSLEGAAVEAAVEVVEALARSWGERGRFPVEDLVRQVVREAAEAGFRDFALRAPPEDLREFPGSDNPQGAEGGVRLVADPSLPRGTVEADLGTGRIRAGLHVQLEEIRRSLVAGAL